MAIQTKRKKANVGKEQQKTTYAHAHPHAARRCCSNVLQKVWRTTNNHTCSCSDKLVQHGPIAVLLEIPRCRNAPEFTKSFKLCRLQTKYLTNHLTNLFWNPIKWAILLFIFVDQLILCGGQLSFRHEFIACSHRVCFHCVVW